MITSIEPIKIGEINYGIACRIGNVIYINKELTKHPVLYSEILNHELEHSSGFCLRDLLMDLRNNHLKGLRKQYYSFILHNPSSWIEFLPCWKYEGKLIWNPSILLMYGVIMLLFGLVGGLLI